MVNLHVHSAVGSLLDSIATAQDIVAKVSSLGQSAVALTDHGKMASFVEFQKACNKAGVKAIHGCEVYEVDNMYEKADTKEHFQQRYHLILLAKNSVGLKNLFKIVSLSNTEGFYKKPLISLDVIKANGWGEGIICLTACMAGRLSKMLVDHDINNPPSLEVIMYLAKLEETFDYVALEIQSHNTPEQMELNSKIHETARYMNMDYVITTDAHMLNKDDQEAHSIFVEISSDREVGESYVDCYLQSDEDVYRVFDGFPRELVEKGIRQSEIIADMIEVIDIGLKKGAIMPKIQIQAGFDSHEEYLKYLVFKDFDKKFARLSSEDREIRYARLETELPVLITLDYTDYFIALYMLAEEAHKRGIPLGYSRGSGANCLCLYMLGVTQIDSVRWDLDFSRFANLGRKSVADFDWDISKKRRKEMITIAEELFGKENVAPICTFNTLSTKVAIRDIGKVLDELPTSPYYKQIPFILRNNVARMIPAIKTINDLGEEEEKEVLLKEVLLYNDFLKGIHEQFPLWFEYVMKLEGLPKSMGRHAAGTLITPVDVREYCPLCYDSDDNIMCQLEMHNAMDDLGLTKMDFLGLETLDIVDEALKIAGLTWADVDINTLDLEDKKVFDAVYKTGNTVGIFQMESLEARDMCVMANADNVEDIIVVNAANRPATKESFPEYCKNKLYPDKVQVVHPALLEIFKKTQFILLYQEQALQLFRYAGFPEEEVDNARRAIGKKIQEVMDSLSTKFKEGLQARDWNEEQIAYVWGLLEKQATYSFNRGHSVAYGLLSYLTAYLKTHYSLAFMTACLSAKVDDTYKLGLFIQEAKRLGINVLPPNVNTSNKFFTAVIKNNSILFGLQAIKGIGEAVVDGLIANRPYSNFNDLLVRTADVSKIDRSVIITLIKSGAIPAQDKKKMLQQYCDIVFEKNNKVKIYNDVATLPTQQVLKKTWDIDCKIIKDKAERLRLYNEKRRVYEEDKAQREYQDKKIIFRKEFVQKYMQNMPMWEFETLSIFLTSNPFEKSLTLIQDYDTIENGKQVTMVGAIIDIDKRTKGGKTYAFVSLYNGIHILELILWSEAYTKYEKFVLKGNNIVALGTKDNDKITVKRMRDYDSWFLEKGLKGV